jgi:hypothetical protein
MLAKYYVTGWSGRFGNWVAEVVEAKNMEIAKFRFGLTHPTLKTIKAYRLAHELARDAELRGEM